MDEVADMREGKDKTENSSLSPTAIHIVPLSSDVPRIKYLPGSIDNVSSTKIQLYVSVNVSWKMHGDSLEIPELQASDGFAKLVV
tara:strand:- start:86 stop:340 length:255 start_codon:yes stop_codon:yes gene_type:complete